MANMTLLELVAARVREENEEAPHNHGSPETSPSACSPVTPELWADAPRERCSVVTKQAPLQAKRMRDNLLRRHLHRMSLDSRVYSNARSHISLAANQQPVKPAAHKHRSASSSRTKRRTPCMPPPPCDLPRIRVATRTGRLAISSQDAFSEELGKSGISTHSVLHQHQRDILVRLVRERRTRLEGEVEAATLTRQERIKANFAKMRKLVSVNHIRTDLQLTKNNVIASLQANDSSNLVYGARERAKAHAETVQKIAKQRKTRMRDVYVVGLREVHEEEVEEDARVLAYKSLIDTSLLIVAARRESSMLPGTAGGSLKRGEQTAPLQVVDDEVVDDEALKEEETKDAEPPLQDICSLVPSIEEDSVAGGESGHAVEIPRELGCVDPRSSFAVRAGETHSCAGNMPAEMEGCRVVEEPGRGRERATAVAFAKLPSEVFLRETGSGTAASDRTGSVRPCSGASSDETGSSTGSQPRHKERSSNSAVDISRSRGDSFQDAACLFCPGTTLLGRNPGTDLKALNTGLAKENAYPEVKIVPQAGFTLSAWHDLSYHESVAVSKVDQVADLPSLTSRKQRCELHLAALRAVRCSNPVAYNEMFAIRAEEAYQSLANKARDICNVLRDEQAADASIQHSRFHGALVKLMRERPTFQPFHVSFESDAAPRVVSTAGVSSSPAHWVLPSSKFFCKRKTECEANDFGDGAERFIKRFDIDWTRVVVKERFVRMIGRSDKSTLATDPAQLNRELNEIKDVLAKHCVAIAMIFVYYSMYAVPAWKSSEVLAMTMDSFRMMIRDTTIISPKGNTCRNMNELDSVFVAANFEEGEDQGEDDANDDDALLRFELLEVIVRVAFAKYIQSKEMTDASDAVERLLEEDMLPHMPPLALVDPNVYRFTRLYNRDTEAVLLDHQDFLHGIFKVYKAKDRTKYFWIEHWKTLLDMCQLIGPGITASEARIVFGWSQMIVKDEIKKRQRAVSLLFFDFLEALCRVADQLGLPSREELQVYYGGKNRMPANAWADYWLLTRVSRRGHSRAECTWLQDEDAFRKDMDGDELHCTRAQVYVPMQPRGSAIGGLLAAKQRPLCDKIEAFVQILVHYMLEKWGGKDETSCAARLHSTAERLSGGIELS